MRCALFLPLLALFAALPLGCDGCGDPSSGRSPPPGPPPLPSLAPPPLPALEAPPRPLALELERGPRPSAALPKGCASRAPTWHAELPTTARFDAAPASLGTLLLADIDGSPPRLRGFGAIAFDPPGPTKAVEALPWPTEGAWPLVARGADGKLLLAMGAPGEPDLSRVLVWREGSIEAIAEGDGFSAVDLRCDEDRCALLTTRPARVAPAGAMLWTGSAASPVASWTRTEIVPPPDDLATRPLAIASLRAGGATTVALVSDADPAETVLWQVDGPDAARPLTRLRTPHGALAAGGRATTPVVLAHGGPVDERGCARGTPGLALVSAEGEHEIRLSGVAARAELWPLASGSFAAAVSPVQCGGSRMVVYAAVLDGSGKPVSAVPVADGEHFAVATRGDEVDLWFQRATTLTWLRMRCDAARPPDAVKPP